jgi:hypothetical protein
MHHVPIHLAPGWVNAGRGGGNDMPCFPIFLLAGHDLIQIDNQVASKPLDDLFHKAESVVQQQPRTVPIWIFLRWLCCFHDIDPPRWY